MKGEKIVKFIVNLRKNSEKKLSEHNIKSSCSGQCNNCPNAKKN